MLTKAFPTTVSRPTLGSNDMEVFYQDYMRAAEALCTHIGIENDYLFAGHGDLILKDRKAVRRKALLMAHHKFTAERISRGLAEGHDKIPHLAEKMVCSIGQVRRLMHINQSLLLDVMQCKERRVDAIMRRIKQCDPKQLAAAHKSIVTDLSLIGGTHVAH